MRGLLLIILVLFGLLVSACQRGVDDWVVMTPDQLQQYAKEASKFPNCSTSQAPMANGVWVDNGWGTWNKIDTVTQIIPFVSPCFRVAWVGDQYRTPWPKESLVYPYREGDLRPLQSVGKLELVEETSSMSLYRVAIDKRTKLGWYTIGQKPAGKIDFVYSVPSVILDSAELKLAQGTPKLIARALRTNEVLAEWDVSAEAFDESMPLGGLELKGDAVTLEYWPGVELPNYSHWLTTLDATTLKARYLQDGASNQPWGTGLRPVPVGGGVGSKLQSPSRSYVAEFLCSVRPSWYERPLWFDLRQGQTIQLTFMGQ